MARIDAVASGLENRQPYASIELDREEAKEMKKFRPGQVVRIVLIASIESLTFRKPDDPDLSGYEGNVGLNVRDMEVDISARNEIAELLDDDEQ